MEAWSSVPTGADQADIEGLFRVRYLEMVRLARLLGADDPEDMAQEALARMMNKKPDLRGAEAVLGYLRAIVVNLTRNRHRHLRVVRLRAPVVAVPESREQAAGRSPHTPHSHRPRVPQLGCVCHRPHRAGPVAHKPHSLARPG